MKTDRLTKATRLNVLRAMLSIAANASKGAAPIRTDVQVLALLKKRIAASRSACEEFAQAERDDLMAKQHAEIAVMDEYARQVKVFPEEEIAEAIEQAYQGLDEERRGKAENILNALLRPGGSLYGKPIDKSQVVRMVKDMVKTKTSPDLGDKLAS